MSLDLRLVQYFLAVAEHGSLSRAADDLGVSQPALTSGLQRLEKRLEVRLFERGRRGSTLTIYGTRFMPHARAMAEAARAAEADFDALRAGPRARIAVGCGPSLAHALVPDAIVRLRALRVAATVRVVEGAFDALLPLIERGELDVAVGTLSDNLDLRGLAGEALLRDRVGIVAARNHPLARRRHLTLARLGDVPWVLPSPGDRLRSVLAERFIAAGLQPPEAAVETGSLATIRALILKDGFLGVMPLSAADPDVAGPGLQPLNVADATWERSVSAVHRLGLALSPAARRFVQCLKAVARRSSS